MSDLHSFGRVCAIVITYNSGNAFSSHLHSLKGQVDHIILVNTSTDDGATARHNAQLRDESPDTISLIESPENNLGLAQNLGIEAALKAGYDWLMILDDDSHPTAGMVAAMERTYYGAKERERIAILAPRLTDPNIPSPPAYVKLWHRFWFRQVRFDAQTPVLDNLLAVSASGSLMPARLFKEESIRMDETFVIDYIDTDFCLKLVKKGYRIVGVRGAELIHPIGARTRHRLFGVLNISTTNHSALRRYYQYRNRVVVWHRCFLSQPGFMMFDLSRLVYELWRVLLVEDNRQQKITAMGRGFWDGLQGKHGAAPGIDTKRTL